MVAPDLSRSASPPCEVPNPTQSRTVVDSTLWSLCMASGFQAMEVRIPCQWNLDSGFQSFAGSLIIPAGLQIPKPRTLDPTSRNQKKKIHSGFHKQRFLIPESGVPDTGQSTDSYWIVGTQVSAADFAGRRTRQRTEIRKRI